MRYILYIFSVPQDWHNYVFGLYTGTIPFDISLEYATGPTPLYSLSKALLNAYTRIFHKQFIEKYNAKYGYNKIRMVSVCPDNFISHMSTDGEEMVKRI